MALIQPRDGERYAPPADWASLPVEERDWAAMRADFIGYTLFPTAKYQ
jgi:hypothetical protein